MLFQAMSSEQVMFITCNGNQQYHWPAIIHKTKIRSLNVIESFGYGSRTKKTPSTVTSQSLRSGKKSQHIPVPFLGSCSTPKLRLTSLLPIQTVIQRFPKAVYNFPRDGSRSSTSYPIKCKVKEQCALDEIHHFGCWVIPNPKVVFPVPSICKQC